MIASSPRDHPHPRSRPDPGVLGRTLKQRRKAVGLTLTQLAELVKVSAAQLSRIETGRSTPSYSTLTKLHEALGLDSGEHLVPLPRPTPEDGLVSRLGALLAVRRSLPLGEASLLLEASITGICAAVAELSDRLAPLGMRVVEDSETVALLPHRTLTLLADRAAEAERIPRLTRRHIEILSIVVFARQATRRRIDEVRGVDSAETVSQLVEWGLLRRTGRDTGDARAHLYQATAKLLEVTGATSLDELRARLLGMVDGDVRALNHPAASSSGEPEGPRGPDPVVREERH
jgi:chromosome segregation and condensation protein ScpB/DNA-binding XRE family transcriptional regulator